jgi:hypothetical protein
MREGHTVTLDELVARFRAYLWLPDPIPLLVVLATIVANHLDGDPVWLLLVGPPSSGKTELINACSKLPHVCEVSTFTKAGLLTGSISRKPTATGGLLVELGAFGIVLCKDFTSVLSEAPETRANVFAALREIYDGQYLRRVGSGGGMTLAWKGKAGMVAAVTETIDRHLAAIGAMGERFIFCRMPNLDDEGRLAQGRAALATSGHETDARAQLAAAVNTFLTPLISDAHQTSIEESADLDWLVSLADLATRCRSVVERDARDRQVELVPQPEATARLTKVLAQLARGLTAIGMHDADLYPILTTLALDGLPKTRRLIIEQLVNTRSGVELTAAQLADRVGLTTDVTSRALDDLAAHRVIERQSVPNHPHRWGPSPWLRERWDALVFVDPTTNTQSYEREASYDDETF